MPKSKGSIRLYYGVREADPSRFLARDFREADESEPLPHAPLKGLEMADSICEWINYTTYRGFNAHHVLAVSLALSDSEAERYALRSPAGMPTGSYRIPAAIAREAVGVEWLDPKELDPVDTEKQFRDYLKRRSALEDLGDGLSSE